MAGELPRIQLPARQRQIEDDWHGCRQAIQYLFRIKNSACRIVRKTQIDDIRLNLCRLSYQGRLINIKAIGSGLHRRYPEPKSLKRLPRSPVPGRHSQEHRIGLQRETEDMVPDRLDRAARARSRNNVFGIDAEIISNDRSELRVAANELRIRLACPKINLWLWCFGSGD